MHGQSKIYKFTTPGAALVRVHMYTTAAGSDGVLDAGRTYDLPKDVAEPFIESGAAAMMEEQPSTPEMTAADPEYPGPWSEENWRADVSLSDWAEWRDPKAWAQSRANWRIAFVGGPPSHVEDRKDRLYDEAIRRLRGHLRTDVEGGRIVLGKPPDNPFDDAKPVSQDALFEILEAIQFSPVRGDEVYFRGAWIELRVYRPERFAPVVAEAKPTHPGRGENVGPTESAVDCSVHDAALQLFGTGEHSRGGKLGDIFHAFMLRRGRSGVYNDPIFNGEDWVFDERLPDPGVVPLDIYMSAADHGDLFLTLIRQGARSGLACEPHQLLEPIPAYGYPASVELTEWMVEDQKMIDRGERSDWQSGERLELHHSAWARDADIFMPALDDRARPICILDGAEPIVFKGAWGLLKDVAVFRSLLGLASIATSARVPRDGTTDRILLPVGTWYDGTMRIGFGRSLLFVPSHDQAKPWVPRLEDISLLNRALHPEWEPGHEITEVDHGIGARPRHPGQSENVVPSAKAEKDCCRWLQAKRAAGPQRAKDGYWEFAREEFKRLSRRGFDRAWANAVGDDPRWTRAGRKPKAPMA